MRIHIHIHHHGDDQGDPYLLVLTRIADALTRIADVSAPDRVPASIRLRVGEPEEER